MKRVKQLAEQRITYLRELATQWAVEGRIQDAQTAIRHMRTLATKHRIRQKTTYCKNCNNPYETQTTHTRIHHNRRILTCNTCKTVKRYPLRKP